MLMGYFHEGPCGLSIRGYLDINGMFGGYLRGAAVIMCYFEVLWPAFFGQFGFPRCH